MFGSWDGPDIASFWFAVAAFVASGWSVWYTRAANAREERRDRESARPPVDARFEKWLSKPIVALFALENRGAVPVGSAVVMVVTGDPKLVGFAENESTHPRLRERDFGRLDPGVPSTAEFVTVDKGHDQTVTFLVTFRSGKDEWREQYAVDLPHQGPFIA